MKENGEQQNGKLAIFAISKDGVTFVEKPNSLTVSCCAHQLVEHSSHLLGGRHPDSEPRTSMGLKSCISC